MSSPFPFLRKAVRGRAVRFALVLAAGVPMTLLSSCSEDENNESGEAEGTPTGSTCPPSSTVTYEKDIAPFMATYCTRCHSSQLTGAARNGAPVAHDFDTEAGILLVSQHVDENAAAGPDAVNTVMPPDGLKPSEADRRKLGEWIACQMAGRDAGPQL